MPKEPKIPITEETREIFSEIKRQKRQTNKILTPEQRQLFVEAGRRGGKRNLEKNGIEHFRAIAPLGAQAANAQRRGEDYSGND